MAIGNQQQVLNQSGCGVMFKSNNINHFQMDSFSLKEAKQDSSYKIYFPQKTFGKATKNRKQDPNMFQLLAWDVDGFQKHSFKKDQKFKQTTDAYMNMIGKNPWTSESQENYINYHQHCIEANTDVLHKIQNYIEERLPQNAKEAKKSPQKVQKSKQKKISLPNEEKKENKYQPHNYMSPKAASNKHILAQATSPKVQKQNTHAEINKSSKKIKVIDDQKQQASTPKHQQNKYYGQNLQKQKLDQHELTQNDQMKLIQNFKQTTRWIPNSAFTTYFGKPPFQNYGRGNTHPIDGGLVYGTYLYSHNVHPHRGKNQPKNLQSYPVALMKAKSQGTLIPMPPRTKPDFSNDLLNSNVAEIDHRSKIQPQLNNFIGTLDIQVPRLGEMQKFGGKRKSRAATENPHHD